MAALEPSYAELLAERYGSIAQLERELYPPLDYLGRTPAQRERDRRLSAQAERLEQRRLEERQP